MPCFVLQGWGYGTLGTLWFGVQVFRQFQVVLEYHILSTILYTIEPKHIMALVHTGARIQISTVDSVESDSPSHVGESKNCWLNRASVQSVGQNVWSWFGCSALLIVTVIIYVTVVHHELFVSDITIEHIHQNRLLFFQSIPRIDLGNINRSDTSLASQRFWLELSPNKLVDILDGSWWSNVDTGSPHERFGDYILEIFYGCIFYACAFA